MDLFLNINSIIFNYVKFDGLNKFIDMYIKLNGTLWMEWKEHLLPSHLFILSLSEFVTFFSGTWNA